MRILLITICLMMAAQSVAASERLALVIGINKYENVTALKKAVNDARAVSYTLRNLGFKVTTAVDADRRTLNRTIAQFSGKVGRGDEVVFYFAGHGIEVAGRNYLLPADVPPASPGDEDFVISESIAADRVLNTLQNRGARVSLLILDACRNNPFPVEGTRSLGGTRGGLARMDPPQGAFILFSAGTGQTALDALSRSDPDPNSVFTRALLPRMRQQGLSIHDLVREVRNDVRKLAKTVRHNQFPAYYDQLSGVFSFNPEGKSEPQPENDPVTGSTGGQPERVPLPPDPCKAARADWQVLSNTSSKSALETFIETHAGCPVFVAAAIDRLDVLSTVPAPAPTPVPVEKTQTTGNTGDICQRLWYQRNLIFHNKGYCFRTQRARQTFGSGQCVPNQVTLSAAEKREVDRLLAQEYANGCRR